MTRAGAPLPPVAELVPHAAPMLALDRLDEWEPGRARATAILRADHPLVRDGAAGGSAALELMAQAVAACLGAEAFSCGNAVRVGMVVACRRLEVYREQLPVDCEWTIDVACLHRSDSASRFDGAIVDGDGERVASASFTLVHGERPPD